MYILAPNQVAKIYQYSIGELRRDNPKTSFPKKPTDATLASWDVYPVANVDPPAFNHATQNLTEGDPVLVDGQWQQTWVVTDATPEEIAERKEQQLQDARARRADAYTNEADPIFFKSQRGEAEITEWEAKVAEIRVRFPYPE